MNDENTEQTSLPPKEEEVSTVKDGIDVSDLKVGYVVGLTPDNELVFELVGNDRTLTDLLGLHAYAGIRVGRVADNVQNSGDKLLHEIGKIVLGTAQEVQKISNYLTKKPGNKI